MQRSGKRSYGEKSRPDTRWSVSAATERRSGRRHDAHKLPICLRARRVVEGLGRFANLEDIPTCTSIHL